MSDAAIDIASAVRSRRVSAVEVVDKSLARIARLDEDIGAFVHMDVEAAREAAQLVDAAVAAGRDPGALAGVPFGVKDEQDVAGMPTSRGSLLFKGAPPARRDSLLVARLRSAGAIPVGKTALPEFGLDSATHSRAWGVTRNPWSLDRTPGGSSGGSAAAVSAGMLPLATGGDSGGSIRTPAAYCGLVGHKPSHGRIPMYDPDDLLVVGALTPTVADTARFLDVTSGPAGYDRTSMHRVDMLYEDAIERLDVRGLRAAWSVDLGYAAVEREVAEIAHGAATRLIDCAGLVAVDRRISLPNPYRRWIELVAVRLGGELQLDDLYPSRSDELGEMTRRPLEKIELSPRTLAFATRARHDVERAAAELFEDIDVLLTPTSSCAPFAAEGPIPYCIEGRDASDTGAEPFTMFANMTWQPAVSVPAGLTASNLPVGLQIVARHGRDDVALRLARVLEQESPWPHNAPGYREGGHPAPRTP